MGCLGTDFTPSGVAAGPQGGRGGVCGTARRTDSLASTRRSDLWHPCERHQGPRLGGNRTFGRAKDVCILPDVFPRA